MRVAALGLIAVVASALPAASQTVSVDVGALYMTRQSSNAPVISNTDNVFPGPTRQGTVFSRDDFMDWNGGIEGGIAVRSGLWGFEVRGFHLRLGENDSGILGNPGGADTFFIVETNPASILATNNGQQPTTASFDSKTSGAELNLTYRMSPAVTVYGGPRWLGIDEKFAFGYLLGAGVPSLITTSWNTNTQLWGAHIGADVDWMKFGTTSGPFGLRTRTGFGLFNNGADATFDLTSGNFHRGAQASGSNTSLMAEASIEGTYKLAPNLTLSAGYKLLWLSDVTTSLAQVGATAAYTTSGLGFANPTMGIAHENVLYHGATARLTYQFGPQ